MSRQFCSIYRFMHHVLCDRIVFNWAQVTEWLYCDRKISLGNWANMDRRKTSDTLKPAYVRTALLLSFFLLQNLMFFGIVQSEIEHSRTYSCFYPNHWTMYYSAILIIIITKNYCCRNFSAHGNTFFIINCVTFLFLIFQLGNHYLVQCRARWWRGQRLQF